MTEEGRSLLSAAVHTAPRLDRAAPAVAARRRGGAAEPARLYGDAYVRVVVEDTTARGRPRSDDPWIELEIADCVNTINLEFSLASRELCENSLFKIDTLLTALHRFRDALAAEAELAAQRIR
jgi:hypothetical protein